MAKFCRYCGTQMSDNAKFCRGCGQAVAAPGLGNIQPSYQASGQNVGAYGNNVCPNCGNTLRPGVRFCRNCGLRLEQTGYPVVNNTQKGINGKADSYKALKIVLSAACIAMIVIGGLTVPGRISRAGSGDITGIFQNREDRADSYEGEPVNGVSGMRDPYDVEISRDAEEYIHDSYEWFEKDDGGWIEKGREEDE